MLFLVQEYKLLMKRGTRYALNAGFCLMAFSVGAVLLKQRKLDMVKKDK